jgi:hypothetical protein
VRFAKAFGAGLVALIVLAFFEFGQYGWIATLIAVGVGVYVWRKLDPNESEPPTQ